LRNGLSDDGGFEELKESWAKRRLNSAFFVRSSTFSLLRRAASRCRSAITLTRSSSYDG